MKTWQILTLSVLGALVAVLLLGLLSAMVYAIRTMLPAEPMTVQVQQPEPQPVAITVEIPGLESLQAALEKLAEQPAPAPIPVPEVIPIVAQPTPVPPSIPQPAACTDLTNIIAETPYFKTWAPTVAARVTVYNLGTCEWSGYYLAPYSVPIPDTLPGGFSAVAFDIPTEKGLTEIILEVRDANGAVVPTTAPYTAKKFDYADPLESVPPGSIIINVPTQDWEGLPIPKWKWYPGMPDGWFFLDGTGYCFGGG